MSLKRVDLLNSGYCMQLNYLAGRWSWRLCRFHAVFVYLEHPKHGSALIDTGYSEQFMTATRRLPERIYRWTTPVRLGSPPNARLILETQGIRPESVKMVFISHFHGDHVAGLRCFPEARFVYRRSAHESLLRESRWKQIRHAFLAELVPDDFVARGQGLDDEDFVPGKEGLERFRILDYWGDGSLLLVDLPGHAVGHTGYVWTTMSKRWFYVVDACWDVDVMKAGRPLPRLSRMVQHDYQAYVETQDKLRPMADSSQFEMVACHCPLTQRHVANAGV